jgi:hypothetical protein
MTKATKVFNLFFYNDSNEREHYGSFATRKAALNVIAEMQAEYGSDVFATEAFEIVANTIA